MPNPSLDMTGSTFNCDMEPLIDNTTDRILENIMTKDDKWTHSLDDLFPELD